MESGKVYRCILSKTAIHPYCSRIVAVDADSGEVLLSTLEGDVEAAFQHGYSSCPAEAVVSREVAANGAEYRYIGDLRHEDLVYLHGWYQGRPKKKRPYRRGGSHTYHMLDLQNIFSLPAPLWKRLLLLAPYMRASGVLADSKHNRSLQAADICAIWGDKWRYGAQRLAQLVELGALYKTGQGFGVERAFIRRG